MVRRWSKLMRGTFSLEADLPVLSDHTHIPKSPFGIFEGRIPRSHGLGSIWALMQQQAVACLVVEDAAGSLEGACNSPLLTRVPRDIGPCGKQSVLVSASD